MSLGRLLIVFASLATFAVAGVAVLAEPPPLYVPVCLALLYAALVVWGVLDLRLEMFGPAITRVAGAEDQVALTFDDGPDPEITPLVLDRLARHEQKATFFLVGKKVARHPEVVKRIVEEGHSVGLHSYDHPRLYAFLRPSDVEKDIQRTAEEIVQAGGPPPIWFRPPVGQMSPRTAAGVERAGVHTIGWSVRARDGLAKTTKEEAETRVLNGLESGAIVLLHDAWQGPKAGRPSPGGEASDAFERAPAGVQALETILRECQRRGLSCVTLDQLIGELS